MLKQINFVTFQVKKENAKNEARYRVITVSLLVMIMTMPVSSNGGRPALPHICLEQSNQISKTTTTRQFPKRWK